jgi:hypothetical protein
MDMGISQPAVACMHILTPRTNITYKKMVPCVAMQLDQLSKLQNL